MDITKEQQIEDMHRARYGKDILVITNLEVMSLSI